MSEIREMKPQGVIKEGGAQGGALALPCKENAEAVGGGRGVGRVPSLGLVDEWNQT